MARESGFTLLEVLIAFAIAAMALTGLFQSSRAGLDNTSIAARTLEAAGLAQSTLAAALRAEPVNPGTRTGGDAGGYVWQTVVTPAGAKPPAPGTASGTTLYRVDVSVAWSAGARQRSVSLSGYRLAQQGASHD